MNNKQLCDALLAMSLKEALKEKDPAKRKVLVEQIMSMRKQNNEDLKNILEFVAKLGAAIAVPVLGYFGLILFRILMNTETPPDVFYREIGKAILAVFKPKT